MPADNEFAARLARIEQRAKTGQKAEYAPLPVHPEEEAAKQRATGGSRLLRMIVLPLCAVTIFAGVFANELSDVLPAEFVDASNSVQTLIIAQIAPDQNDAASVTAPGTPVSGNAASTVDPDTSEVSRILLGE